MVLLIHNELVNININYRRHNLPLSHAFQGKYHLITLELATQSCIYIRLNLLVY